MIWQARIGEISICCDDEMTEQRPTPEATAEYARRLGMECYDLWHAVTERYEAITKPEP